MAADEKTVLVADDDAAIRTVVTQALVRAGYDVKATGTASSLWHWVANGEGDLVVTDVLLPDQDAFQILPRMKKIRPHLPIIVMSAKNTIVTAIRAAELGAFDYLPKPFDLNELVAIAGRALQARRANVAVRESPDGDEHLPIIGRSPVMQDIYRVIARLTQSDLTVLIAGESGTRQRTRSSRASRFRQAPQRTVRGGEHGGHSPRTHRIRTVRP